MSEHVALSIADIDEVQQSHDATSQPMIGLKLTERGAKKLAKITADNVKKKLAMIVEGKIVQAPVIMEKITRSGDRLQRQRRAPRSNRLYAADDRRLE